MSNPGEKERPTVLIMYSLAVTLASLWQIGIGRVVIVGRTQETPELMTAAFTIVEHLIETGKETVPMEMAYWVCVSALHALGRLCILGLIGVEYCMFLSSLVLSSSSFLLRVYQRLREMRLNSTMVQY